MVAYVLTTISVVCSFVKPPGIALSPISSKTFEFGRFFNTTRLLGAPPPVSLTSFNTR